jgi:PAS domain-containing protein
MSIDDVNPQPIRPFLNRLDALTSVLEKNEIKRQKILDFMRQVPCICFMKNAETGKYEYVNREMCEITHRSEEQIVGKTDLELFPLEDAQLRRRYDLRVMKTKRPIVYITQRDGKLFIFSKFLVINGNEAIGCFGLELPPLFTLENKESESDAKSR